MSVDDLADRVVKSALLERPYNGIILDSATAHNHPVRVTIPDFDPLRSFGPLLWPSMVTSEGVPLLPQEGDEALVLFDQDQQPWIARWRGGVEDPGWTVDARLDALELARIDPIWAATGTNSVPGGTTEALEGGTELFDPYGIGGVNSVTVAAAGTYVIFGHATLYNTNSGVQLIMDSLINGGSAVRLLRVTQSQGPGADVTAGGFNLRDLVAGQTVTGNVFQGDGANTRSVDWRMLVARLRAGP